MPKTTKRKSKPKKFLSPAELAKGTAEVVALAKREKIRVVLVGGYAMQHYGSDRLTGDLDFASDGAPSGLPVIGPLTFGGVRTTTSAGVPTDFIVRDDLYAPLYEEVVAVSAVSKAMGVRVATPEHLAAMKMASGREKDMLDLKFLLGVDGLVNMAKAQKIILRFLGPYATEEFACIVDEAAWERSGHRRSNHRPRR